VSRLRLTRRRLLALARRFDRAESGTLAAERALKSRLARRRRRGASYLTRAELVWLGDWKSPRIRPQIARNTPAGVRGVTAAAFLTGDEARRVRLLCGLAGVGIAVASVLLHFADPRRYPVYDIRVQAALRRLGIRARFPPTPEGWTRYLRCLRTLAGRYRISLRTLDKSLWLLGAAPRLRPGALAHPARGALRSKSVRSRRMPEIRRLRRRA
jgi:hypothetical protein